MLALKNVTYDMNGSKYRCIVSSETASVASAEVTVTVNPAEKVTEAEVTEMSENNVIRFINAFSDRYAQTDSDCNVITGAQVKAIELVLENDHAA